MLRQISESEKDAVRVPLEIKALGRPAKLSEYGVALEFDAQSIQWKVCEALTNLGLPSHVVGAAERAAFLAAYKEKVWQALQDDHHPAWGNPDLI